MIESDRDRETLNVVRPFAGRSSGGVYGETVAVQAHMSDQNEHQSVEMEKFCGEEFGERKSRKMQDPKLPSSEEVLEHNFNHLLHRDIVSKDVAMRIPSAGCQKSRN